MTRHHTKVPLQDGRVRWAVTVQDDVTDGEGDQVRLRYWAFLGALGAQPDLLLCGLYLPSTVTIRHDGQRWVAEAQAVVPAEPGGND
jgi:hypothetical protein